MQDLRNFLFILYFYFIFVDLFAINKNELLFGNPVPAGVRTMSSRRTPLSRVGYDGNLEWLMGLMKASQGR